MSHMELCMFPIHLNQDNKKGDNAFKATRKQLLGRVSDANIQKLRFTVKINNETQQLNEPVTVVKVQVSDA
jgi:hypothetical protein